LDQVIYVNGRFLTQPATGVQRFARQMLTALDKLIHPGQAGLGGQRWVCLTPPGSFALPDWRSIEVRRVGRLTGNLWEQIDLPLATAGELLVNLGNIGPFIKQRQAIVFHDASVFAVPQAYSRAFRFKHQTGLRVLGKTAPAVFTVSQFSRQEMVRYAAIKAEKIHVLTEGCEHILDVAADCQVLEKYGLRARPYLLVVSNLSPHKNLAGLIRALQLLPEQPFEVVFAGTTFAPVFQVNSQPLPEIIRQIGSISDAELRALYEGATAFIYPSFYEGFGLPPLEAMRCGCPVIVSRAASLPEVCGTAALYCDPHDPADIARQIVRLMTDRDLQQDLRQRGLAHASRYTWPAAAQAMLNGLESALS